MFWVRRIGTLEMEPRPVGSAGRSPTLIFVCLGSLDVLDGAYGGSKASEPIRSEPPNRPPSIDRRYQN